MQKPVKITKYWRISRILEEFPDSVEVFMEYDLDCVGCSASSTERLIDGLQSHDYSEQTIQEIMQRLNQISEQKFNYDQKDNVKKLENLKICSNSQGFKIGEFQIEDSAINAIKSSNSFFYLKCRSSCFCIET